MRYFEIIEASKLDHDPEYDRQERAELWRKLDNARRKRNRAAQEYQDRTRTADAEQRKAQQELAETDKPDPDTERRLWQSYWAKQQRIAKALAADAEKRSRGASTSVSALISAPASDRSTGLHSSSH
jgi:Na+-translocating ferredoxin:NAD+ oxidoreductase RnfC subunit